MLNFSNSKHRYLRHNLFTKFNYETSNIEGIKIIIQINNNNNNK